MTSIEGVREQVRARYAAVAQAVAHGPGCGGDGGSRSDRSCCTAEALNQDSVVFGAGFYDVSEQAELPEEASLASMGCGNPVAVAELRPGETVLDLGSGGGIDVLLSARRVGRGGFVYGVDMTEEMLSLARANAARAGATNVEFLEGTIEDLPLPDASIDVVISNCVINLSGDKPAVLAEMLRVLKPGGRIGISDVVAEDQLTPAERAQRGSFSGCIAGALSKQEYLDGLTAVGFADPVVRFTHEAEPQMHAAIIQATKPEGAPGSPCCSRAEHASCCELKAKADCCGASASPASASCDCR